MRRMPLLLVVLVSLAGVAGAQTRTLNVGGGATINYDVTGRGPTVVFIHGWSHNISVWDDQVPAFKTRYQVLRYDSRGFGRSTGFADESAEPHDLLVLLEALHVKRAFIVGHSRGGRVALRFASAFPNRVAGLVLYGGFPGGAPAPPEVGEWVGPLPSRGDAHGPGSEGQSGPGRQ